MPSRVYWDSCCFIGLLQQEEDKVAALGDLAQRATADRRQKAENGPEWVKNGVLGFCGVEP